MNRTAQKNIKRKRNISKKSFFNSLTPAEYLMMAIPDAGEDNYDTLRIILMSALIIIMLFGVFMIFSALYHCL